MKVPFNGEPFKSKKGMCRFIRNTLLKSSVFESLIYILKIKKKNENGKSMEKINQSGTSYNDIRFYRTSLEVKFAEKFITITAEEGKE